MTAHSKYPFLREGRDFGIRLLVADKVDICADEYRLPMYMDYFLENIFLRMRLSCVGLTPRYWAI